MVSLTSKSLCGLSTFQHTERRPAVICGALCDETWIFRSVKE